MTVLYFVGLALYLTWVLWWYDILLHFLGGVWVGLAVCTAFSFYERQPRFVHIIAGVLVIGVAWELFEVAVGAPREANYAFDTSLDLVMDTIGSIAGFFVARHVSEARETPAA